MTASFIEQTNDRRLSPDYDGDILVWDIDKTYLDTSFSSFRGLIAIPFEFAVDKSSLPGAVKLIRALRHGPAEQSALVPLYFVSGSPKQLRTIIEQKMTLDGVDFDGITFKDQWGLLKAGRPRDIKAQVGYKLQALLRYRRELPDGARYLMFGDDVEEDADAFTLFGEVCAGLRGEALRARLLGHHVNDGDVMAILSLADAIPAADDPVERVFVHLSKDTDHSRFKNPKVVPTLNYLQTGMVLAEMGRLQAGAVATIAKDLRRRRMSEADIAASVEDAKKRLGVSREIAEQARF